MLTKHPLVSICIPAYNRPHELVRLLSSIDVSDTDKIEIIICEDKSPNRDVIRQEVALFVSKTQYKIYYFENDKNLGYDKNLREVISKSNGFFILFMGDDDIFVPTALDMLMPFLEDNLDIGYMLKSHQFIRKDGEIVPFRYFSENKYFQPSELTLVQLFRKSIFISGFTIRRELVKDLTTDRFDGKLVFQLYLLGEVALNYKCAYFDIPLTQAYDEGTPFFGMSDAEKGLFTPGCITANGTLNLLKGLFEITSYLDQKYNINATPKVKRDISKYFYPYLAQQRANGISEMISFMRQATRIGLNVSINYYLYAIALILFGKMTCDSIILHLKKGLGKTPEL